MDLQLKDKVIIVTGGAKGIGEGIVRVLAAEGALPVIIGRNLADKNKLVEDLAGIGMKACQVVAELSKPDECEKAVKTVVQQFGKLNAVVNNAGVNDSIGLENGSYEGFIASLHKNVGHYYLIVHHAVAELVKSKGSIVNIGSKTAETGQGGTSAYAAVREMR
jgi:L-fucose dehydrogenase